MYKHHTILCGIVWIIGMLFFLSGCEKKSEPPKPQVVRKKITAKAPPIRRAQKSKAVQSTRSKASFRPKSAVSKTPKSMVTAKSKKAPAAATPKGTQATVKPKGLPAKTKIITIKPKSAISKTPEALKDKKKVAQKGKTPPPPGGTKSKPKTTTLKPAKARAKTKMKAPEDKTVAASTKTAKELKTVQTQKAYNPLGKLDPFEPLFKERPVVTQVKRKIKKRTPRTPLEKIAISQLKLVGIVLAPSGNKALVQEASGKGYIIKKGTYIGLNSGKVVDIQKNNVIIKEEVEDVLGKVIVRKKEIRLPKPIGE